MTDDATDAAPAQQQQRVRTVRQLDSLVEQKIREAAERGAFDNLSTRGRPVDLDLKDAIDHEAWFVNRTMKSLGAVPAWMELGKEIDADEARLRWMAEDFAGWIVATRRDLLPLTPREREQRRAGIALRFDDRFGRYLRLVEGLRKKIDRFNQEVPVRVLEKPGLWAAHERRRLCEPYAALCRELGWPGDDDAATAVSEAAPSTPSSAEAETPDARERRHRILDMLRRSGRER